MNRPLPIQESVVFEVSKGATLSSLAQELEARGWLSHALSLRLWVRAYRVGDAIHAGEYDITPGMSVCEWLNLLVSGNTIHYTIRFIEGMTVADIRQELVRHPKLVQDTLGLSPVDLMTEIGMTGIPAEGRFFPDTYDYQKGHSDRDILRRAAKLMDSELAQAWASREPDLPIKTPEEALVLASIIEKETGVPSERPAIAGVFVRRLRLGMRLQTDPTVIYGLGDAYKGNLTRQDLLSDSPYNTYRISGLPPTPIAAPGKAALQAAVHPALGDALYFVARGDGSHHFSATLEEHNEAVRKYQLTRAADYRSSPAP